MDHFATAAQSATPAAQANLIRQQLQESRPDVMRHKGDKTIKIVKRAGKPIGEIGTDAEASPGNGAYYVKLYDGSYDAVGFDTAEEALAELKYAVKQMSEGSLTEFAPSDSGDGGGDDDGFDEDTLRKLAAQWFAGDEDPQVERLLAAAGWEIGQDEGYDDEPGVFVVMSGDDDGRSYISWPAEELRSDVAEQGVAEGVKKMSPQQQHDFDRMRYGAMSRKEYDAKWKKPLKSDDEVIYGKKKEPGVSEDAAANNPVVNAITRRIMLQRTDLLSKYGPEKVGQAVDEVADFVGDVEEIGSSDVSGWVRHVEQMLGNMEQDVAEEAAAPTFKPGDRVMYAGKFATVVAQDGDAYGIRVDAQPGTMKVLASQIKKPSYDESVAESIDPIEQLRADIRRFAL
jgi:hypothetical protein